MHFAPPYLEMRDVMGDATHRMQKLKKRPVWPIGRETSFRAIDATWRRQVLQDNDKPFAKGRQIKIKEDGDGGT